MNPDKVIAAMLDEDPALRRLYYDDVGFHRQVDNLARVLLPILVRSLAAECRRDADDLRLREMELRLRGEGTPK